MSTPPVSTDSPTPPKTKSRTTKGFHILTIVVIVITALLGVGISLFTFWALTVLDEEKINIEFIKAVDNRLNVIQHDLVEIGTELQSVAALYQVHPDTSKKEFSAFVTPILQRHESIQSISWIPSVQEEERELTEKKAHEEGQAAFRITQKEAGAEEGSRGHLVPADKRDLYYPLYYIEPSAEHIDIVGFDLGSDQALLETINKARTSRNFVLSPRITFFQEKDDSFSVALMLPVFANRPTKAEETPTGPKEFVGVVTAVIHIADLVNNAMKKLETAFINLYIYDSSAPEEKSFLFFYDMEPWLHRTNPANVSAIPATYWSSSRTVEFGGRKWILAFHADEFGAEQDISLLEEYAFPIILGIFVLLSLGLASMVWFLIKRIKERDLRNALEDSVKQRTQELGTTIEKLKMTQAQLVAQEKLASLGSLTAGIAHELKNPLNFINNFSDLSIDLLPEITGYIEKSKAAFQAADLEGINESINTLKSNLGSIAEQGKKANKIILTMLEHAKKSSSGQFALTDIHFLLDQSIEKTYQACQQTNPDLNVVIDKEFDVSVGKLDLVGEDIEKAFINILNNAFYAVAEKKKTAGEGYTPRIMVKTEKVGDSLRVTIRDNGTGISEASKGKIFTPFFTTKPTGLGAGLGLSLSHDIIADEHSGTLTFTSVENDYTEFVSTLPITQKKQKEVID